ncbi:hypothetical protein HYX58_02590 [Candidatus Dependentiae bacterium]|nr:hypothetical protein [Candidatus Dependentiae bacterium]
MVFKKFAFLLLFAVVAFGQVDAFPSKRKHFSREQCETSNECYCSQKGDFRQRHADDNPVYVENDPNGVFCYCKQWDLDNFPGPKKRNRHNKYRAMRTRQTGVVY